MNIQKHVFVEGKKWLPKFSLLHRILGWSVVIIAFAGIRLLNIVENASQYDTILSFSAILVLLGFNFLNDAEIIDLRDRIKKLEGSE